MANLGEGKNSLHTVLDAIERIKDKVDTIETERSTASEAQVAQLEAEKAASLEKINEIEARCNKLDEMLPRGEKVFTTGVRSKDQDLAAFGRAFTVARRAANGDPLPADYARAGQLAGTTTVTNSTTGGTLVPIETYDSAVRIIGEKSLARQICRQIPMTTNEMIVPIVNSDPTVYWAAEGAIPAAESAVGFENSADAQLKAKTLTAYDSISRELEEDSLVALEPFFAEVFGDAIAKEENNVLINGNGAAPMGGFTGVDDHAGTAVVPNTSSGFDVSFDDIIALMFAVNGDVVNNGTFVMSMAMLGQVVGIKATTTGAPLFASAWGAGGLAGPGSNLPDAPKGLAGYLLGRPVYVTNTMATSGEVVGQSLMVYGDFNQAIFGDRRSLSIEMDDSVFFASRRRCMLAYERIGFLISGGATGKANFARLNEIGA